MDDDQQFCLRWNNHQSTLISQFDTLLESETLVDCTLAAEGKYLRAHKVVLSACSPYFEALLKLQYDKHPVFILKDVKYQELRAMMDYMYRGEVNISQDQLGALLKAAESLQIKGLSDSKSGGEKKPTRQPSPQPPPITSKSLTISKQAIKQPASALDSDGLGSPSRGRETSSSPTPRKRKKLRRRSQDDHISDNHDPHSNTSSTHSQPANVNIPLAPISKPALDSLLDPLETLKQVTSSALDHSLLSISAVHKDNAKQEPHSELILEPKAEYVDEDGNDDSVEDLTLDDEEMDDLDQSQAGPSHSGEGSSQGFTWHMGGDRTQDEVFMAAQDAAAGHRDSQVAAPKKIGLWEGLFGSSKTLTRSQLRAQNNQPAKVVAPAIQTRRSTRNQTKKLQSKVSGLSQGMPVKNMSDSLHERHQVVSAQSPSTPAQMQITLREQQNKSSLSEVAPSMVKKVSFSHIMPGQEQNVLSLPEDASGIVKENSNNTSILGPKQMDSSFSEPESSLTKKLTRNQTIPEQQKKVPSHSGTTSGILQLHKPSNHYEITPHPSKEVTKTFDQSKVAPCSSLVKPVSDLVREVSDIVYTADVAQVEKPKKMLVKYRDGYIYQTVNVLTDPKENINNVKAHIKQSNVDLVKPDGSTAVLSKGSETSDILEIAPIHSKKISDLVKDPLVQPKKIDILENICLQISNKIINKVREKSEITSVEPEKLNLKNRLTNEAQSICTQIEEVVLSHMEKTYAEINKKIVTENVDQPKIIVPLVQSSNKTDLRKIPAEPTVIDILENIPSQSRKESDQAQGSVKPKACDTSPCQSRLYSRPLKSRFQRNTMKKNPKKRNRCGMTKTSKVSSKKKISPVHITPCKFLKSGGSLEEECNSSDANYKFICGQCGKKYSHKRNLYRHIKYECNKKPQFQCSICSKGFTQNKTLKEHLTRMHDIRFLQSPDPPHETPGCSKPANGPNTPACSPSKDKTNQETPGSSFVEKIKLIDKTNYQETPASSPSKGDANK